MLEKITVCKKENGKLYPIEEKKMMTYLDEEKMELFVIYKMERFPVLGNMYTQYIVTN